MTTKENEPLRMTLGSYKEKTEEYIRLCEKNRIRAEKYYKDYKRHLNNIYDFLEKKFGEKDFTFQDLKECSESLRQYLANCAVKTSLSVPEENRMVHIKIRFEKTSKAVFKGLKEWENEMLKASIRLKSDRTKELVLKRSSTEDMVDELMEREYCFTQNVTTEKIVEELIKRGYWVILNKA